MSLSIDEEYPDEDIGHESQGGTVAANSYGTVPEESEQRPGIWSSYNWQVDEWVQAWEAPVESGLVDQAEDIKDLSPPELSMREEQGKGQNEEVIEHKVRSHIGGRSNVLFI